MKLRTAAVTTSGFPDYPRGFLVHGTLVVYFQFHSSVGAILPAQAGHESPLQTTSPQTGRQIIQAILKAKKKAGKDATAQRYAVLSCLQTYPTLSCAVVGSIQGTTIHLAGIGSGAAILVRSGTAGMLIQNAEAATGTLQPDDVLLLTSQITAQTIPADQWSRLSVEGTVDQIAETLLAAFPPVSVPQAALVIAPAKPWKEEVRSQLRRILHHRKSHLHAEMATSSSRSFTRMQRLLFLLTMGCILLITASIFITVRHQQDLARQELFDKTTKQVQQQLAEAVALQNLNPVRSRELLTLADGVLSRTIKLYDPTHPNYRQLQQLKDSIHTQEQRTNHIAHLDAVPLFFDIGLIKPGGMATQVAAYHELKALLDDTNHILYLLATDTRQATILAGPDVVKDAHTVAMHGTLVYVLNADGVTAIDTKTKKSDLIIPHEDAWGEILSISTYGGNIYLLDKMNQTIWKYIQTEEGYAPLDRYLPEGTPFTPAADARLIIDGSIWVNNHTSVTKYSNGIEQPFAPTDVPDEVSTIDRLSSSDLDGSVYLLNAAEQRIVVLGKDGTYQHQYSWAGLKDATDIVASEAEQKLFVLAGSKIYAIALQ